MKKTIKTMGKTVGENRPTHYVGRSRGRTPTVCGVSNGVCATAAELRGGEHIRPESPTHATRARKSKFTTHQDILISQR